ncbi:uncharacterized protein LOC107636510 [Arachis ipaensis]|uniref:uncharacterized protein LOC107636510 n=1 Tax=Arachis ipaensis TaxID=130454 RepID=UPI0007AF2956|nr:uncharacterized protein LOC107636510 [Arachis ipaensis]
MGSGAGEGAVVVAGAAVIEGAAEDVAASAEAVKNGELTKNWERNRHLAEPGLHRYGIWNQRDGGGGELAALGGGHGGGSVAGQGGAEEEKGGVGFCEGGAVVRARRGGLGVVVADRWWQKGRGRVQRGSGWVFGTQKG